MKAALGWLGRQALLFALLVGAVMLYWSTRPSFESWRELRDTAAVLAAGQRALARDTAVALAANDRDVATLHRLSQGALAEREARARRALRPIAGACDANLAGLLVGGGAARVIANRRDCARAALLAREIATVEALRSSLDARRPGETVDVALRRHIDTMRRAAARYRRAEAALARLRGDLVPDFAQPATPLRSEMAVALAAHAGAEAQGRALLATRRSVSAASRDARAALAAGAARYAALTDERAQALSANGVERARAWAKANNLPAALRWAAWALAGIIAGPLLVRALCFFVLAPLVVRRPPIRLAPAGAPIPPADRSGVSLAVRLSADEELLVRQTFLQTTSLAGPKRTQWFLDWRKPLTSAAAGLTFLTRIRGAGEATTVSAVRDPFAEVALLTLPAGAACVLHPRALAAVAQPIGRPLRIQSRWRLGSLHAWLTWQLRFLVFHGPARLVVAGGRGVRVEPAARGRVFGRDQLIGFSADLAYASARTETFWPYFLGREPLLKDRVAGNGGVLVVEEAPLSARVGGAARRGLEGLVDAVMKVFGV